MPPEPKGIERRWVLYSDFPHYWRCRNGDSPKLGAKSYKTVEVMPVADHLAVLGEVRGQVDCKEEERCDALDKLNLLQDEFDREKAGRMAAEEQLRGLREGLRKEIDGLDWASDLPLVRGLRASLTALLDTYSVDEGSGS